MPHHQKQVLSKLSLVFIIISIYLIWMDVALYINLQQLPPLDQRTTKKVNSFSCGCNHDYFGILVYLYINREG